VAVGPGVLVAVMVAEGMTVIVTVGVGTSVQGAQEARQKNANWKNNK